MSRILTPENGHNNEKNFHNLSFKTSKHGRSKSGGAYKEEANLGKIKLCLANAARKSIVGFNSEAPPNRAGGYASWIAPGYSSQKTFLHSATSAIIFSTDG